MGIKEKLRFGYKRITSSGAISINSVLTKFRLSDPGWGELKKEYNVQDCNNYRSFDILK